MSTGTDGFRLADIGGELGVGEVGHQVVDSLDAYHNETLVAALTKKANDELTAELTDGDRAFIDSIADGTLISCSVVGDADRATVVYMEEDHRGDLLKGCIPLSSVEARSERGHVSHAGELQKTAAASEHLEQQRLREQAAEPASDEVLQENEDLRRLLDAASKAKTDAGKLANEKQAAERAASDAKAAADAAKQDAQEKADQLQQAEDERVKAEQDAAEAEQAAVAKDAKIAELERQLAEAQEAATAPDGPPAAAPGGADAAAARPAAKRAAARKS